jgi:peptide deformylase
MELSTLPESKRPELRLVIWPDKSLKDAVAPFPEGDISSRLVRDTAGAMIRSMYKHYGVGLAAQQVGIPFQMFVMDSQWTQTNRKKPRVFINPRVVNIGEGAQQLPTPGEGCLSFPYDYRHPVARLDKLELEWLDTNGNVHHQWFEGYEAIIIQHEFDHLMGFCFYDRLSRLKRDMAFRKARKIRRKYGKGYKRGLNQMKHSGQTPEFARKALATIEQGDSK